ncbi:MAG: hypothetical protein WD295_01765, partial [Bacteroidota bacterium]
GYTMELTPATLTAELLFVKRLHRSSVRNPIPAGGFVELPGSDQSQINILLRGALPLGEEYILNCSVAVPLLKRTVNVDGLTRALSLSVTLARQF